MSDVAVHGGKTVSPLVPVRPRQTADSLENVGGGKKKSKSKGNINSYFRKGAQVL